MTKLMEWLSALVVLLAIYLSLVTRQVKTSWTEAWMFEIQIAPIIAVGLFGIYSVFIVLYRTFTFNDCPEAADEIQRQIKEAKEDLAAKGLKL